MQKHNLCIVVILRLRLKQLLITLLRDVAASMLQLQICPRVLTMFIIQKKNLPKADISISVL